MKNKNIILTVALAVVILGAGVFNWQHHLTQQTSASQGHHDLYYCPMHPQILYDHPGRCPICGMDLVKRVDTAQQQGSTVEGYTTIPVTDQGQQLAGVKTAVVEKKALVKTIRAAGQYQGEVFADIFESDLQFIKVGQKAVVDVLAYDKKYAGAVNSIDTMIDETSRTIRVRIWIEQRNQRRLKDNMFVNVELPVMHGEGIVVPRDAVMDTGIRKIVFVQKNEGNFEPREIQTGWETDDGYEVKSGLKEGERIVVSGNFLLDSESRVQAGLQASAAAATQGEAHGQ